MAFTGLTTPNKYNVAYSPVPLRAKDDNVGAFDRFNYLSYVRYDELFYNTTGTVVLPEGTFREIQTYSPFPTPAVHNYKKGDKLLITRTTPTQSDFGPTLIQVFRVTSPTTFLVGGANITNIQFGNVSRFSEYKLPVDPDGEVKINLSNTLKDLVKTNFTDVCEPRKADETRVNYSVTVGSITDVAVEFSDDYFAPGQELGFRFSGAVADTPFAVGQTVFVERDDYAWNYTSYDTNISPILGVEYYEFNGAADAYFDITYNPLDFATREANIVPNNPNDPILSDTNFTNTTQKFIGKSDNADTEPYQRVTSNVVWNGLTPVPTTSGGTIYAQVNVAYNGAATITDIIDIGGGEYVVVVDKTWDKPTPPIAGTMKLSVENDLYRMNELQYTGLTAFVGVQPQYSYDKQYYNPYVITDDSVNAWTGQTFSTIYDSYSSGKKYRIEKSSKQWLLAHIGDEVTIDSSNLSVLYQFYDKADNLINASSLPFSAYTTGELNDVYVPVCLEELQTNPNLNTLSGSPYNTIYDEIDTLIVTLNGVNDHLLDPIEFEINNDCSRFEILHLTWEDRLGSFISYPFIYANKRSTEVERQEYYKELGNWNDDNTYSINSYDRGNATYFTRGRDKIQLNSGWVTDAENELIKDLFKSNKVFFQDSDGTIYGAILNQNEVVLETDDIAGVHQYKISIKLVQDDIRL